MPMIRLRDWPTSEALDIDLSQWRYGYDYMSGYDVIYTRDSVHDMTTIDPYHTVPDEFRLQWLDARENRDGDAIAFDPSYISADERRARERQEQQRRARERQEMYDRMAREEAEENARRLEGMNPETRGVLSYSFKPAPVFHGTPPLFLGMELEVETPYRDYYDDRDYYDEGDYCSECDSYSCGGGFCADCDDYHCGCSASGSSGDAVRVANRALGRLGYLKHDSSVAGFEIVTQPMAYDWALDNFPWRMLGTLDSMRCTTHDGCGLHVHVSRDAFNGETHVYRWLKFFYRNRRNVQRIARRDSDAWASFSNSERRNAKYYAKGFPSLATPLGHPLSCTCDGCNEMRDNGSYDPFYGRTRAGRRTMQRMDIPSPPGRGVAVNCLPKATFEIRAFRSSLDVVEVQAALGLVDASVRYADAINANDVLRRNAWDWASFASYVRNNDDHNYASLIEMI